MAVRSLVVTVSALLLVLALPLRADPVAVGIVVNPFNGDRAGPELDGDAQAMLDGGLIAVIEAAGGRVASQHTVSLSADEDRQYGRWNRFGLASGHLADHAAGHAAAGLINLGLYNNCSSLLGMLGGLRHAASPPRRVGLVWIDAHGDYNTPETTLSGMLGGMPVAIAAGDALQRMRQQARLDEPLSKQDIVMAGVRDTDPLEQQRIDADGIVQISVADLRALDDRFHAEMARLTAQTDVVYVHVDLDVLDPREIPGHPLTVADGPTGTELGAAIEAMFRYPKTEALGLASYPHRDDPGGVTMKAIHALVAGAVRGAAAR
jgi:arginase